MMFKKEDRSLRQIRVPQPLYQAVRHYCVNNCITLAHFYKQMFHWYLAQDNNIYFASYKKGRIMSIWIDGQQLSALKQSAKFANVSDARIVFTALILYCQQNKIYEFIEDNS